MVNKQLKDYIKSQKKRGLTSNQIEDYLIKQGYPKKDIENVLTYHEDKLILFSLTLLISTILSSTILASIFSLSGIGYPFKILLILALGFVTIILLKNSTERERLWLFASTFIASTSAMAVFIFTRIAYFINAQLIIRPMEASSPLGMATIFAKPNPIIDTSLVYVIFIVPTLIYFLRKKEKDIKQLYKIAISMGIVAIICLILNFILGRIMNVTMAL